MQYVSIFDNVFIIALVWGIRITGVLVLSINLILDTSYIFLSTFGNRGYYGIYSLMLVIRYVIPILGIVRHVVVDSNKPLNFKDLDGSIKSGQAKKRVTDENEFFKKGTILYASLPFCFLIGTYRLLNFKNFNSEISAGLIMDFFIAGLSFLMV